MIFQPIPANKTALRAFQSMISLFRHQKTAQTKNAKQQYSGDFGPRKGSQNGTKTESVWDTSDFMDFEAILYP